MQNVYNALDKTKFNEFCKINSGCGIIVFNSKLETILVESRKGKNNCSFPKGRKDFPEETDIECASRELQEETGLTMSQITLVNQGQIFVVEPIKKHQIGYFLAVFNGDDSFEFTFDPKELKDKPYWANRKTVLQKFYGGMRREIYERAYEYVTGYFAGKSIEVEKPIVSILKKTSESPTKTANSWASIASKNAQQQQVKYATVPEKTPVRSLLTADECVRIGKTLSWLLRHGIKERCLTMREDAYVLLADVFAQKEFASLSIADVKYIVENNSKKRYSLLDENGVLYIKANQGHSSHIGDQIDQLKAFNVITSPYAKCIHGTDRKAWKAIQNTGLKKMARQHIHFAQSEPSDRSVISGARSNATVFIYIDMAKAIADGIIFYLSDNGVILSEGLDGTIDKKYFSRVVDVNGKVYYEA